jgi:hypothetical protein
MLMPVLVSWQLAPLERRDFATLNNLQLTTVLFFH